MDKFSYIVPPSPITPPPPTTIVDSYYPTSNWQDGQWAYQDLSYMLHNPALRLPMERPPLRPRQSSESRMASNAQPMPMPQPAPQPAPAPPSPDTKKEGGANIGAYFIGGIALLAIGFAILGTTKGINLKKTI